MRDPAAALSAGADVRASFAVDAPSPAATESIGEAWGRVLRTGDLLLLLGELGVGKTTLARGVGRGLGVTARVKSPTFAIHVVYPGRIPLHHLDLYRVIDPGDLEELGLGDWLGLDGAAVVEWGERLPPPPWGVAVRIAETGEGSRRLHVVGPEEVLRRLAGSLSPAPEVEPREGA